MPILHGGIKTNLSHTGGGAESHYPTMSIAEMCDLPIKNIANSDSVLLMWVTMPMMKVSFQVIKAWGFKYKTCAFTWVKTNRDGSVYMGMGRHTRGNAEVCLLATRGKGISRKNAGIYNTQLHKRENHSKKPDFFRDQISLLYGSDISKIELFARDTGDKNLFGKNRMDGWDTWGNEVKSSLSITVQN